MFADNPELDKFCESARAFPSIPLPTKKSNPHYSRDITPKRVASGEIHLRGLAPGQHSSEKNIAGVVRR